LLGNPAGFERYPLWVVRLVNDCPDIPSPPWNEWAFWQYSFTGTVAGIAGDVDRDRWNGTVDDLKRFASIKKPPANGNGNDALSILDWPDGHSEVFAVTPAGDLMHSANGVGDDNWSMPAALDGNATCGFASSFWGAHWLYPELFSPLKNGSTGHL